MVPRCRLAYVCAADNGFGAPMNHSIYTADRATHLKIVIMALTMATAVAGIGISFRSVDIAGRESVAVVVATKAPAMASAAVGIAR